MTANFNLNSVAREYPEEIRIHPIPLVFFWGDPATSESLFGYNFTNTDSPHVTVSFLHKPADFSLEDSMPRSSASSKNISQRGVIKANWFYKHAKLTPSGIDIFSSLHLCIVIFLLNSCCLFGKWKRIIS